MKIKFVLFLVISTIAFSSSYSSTRQFSKKDPKTPVQIEFEKGESSIASNFFEGLVYLIVEVDVQYRRFEYLDSIQTSTLKSFKKTYKSVLSNIKYARKIFKKHEDPKWKLQAKFMTLSYQWLDQIEFLTKTHIKPLIDKMIVPDSDWSDEDIKLWETYSLDYETYYTVDSDWVDFQYTFAAANQFKLGGTIDEQEMIKSEDED